MPRAGAEDRLVEVNMNRGGTIHELGCNWLIGARTSTPAWTGNLQDHARERSAGG
jgi:hypothetical protein